jgi:hypothetical protein
MSTGMINTFPPFCPERKTQTWYKTGCMGTKLCTLDTCNNRTRGPRDVPKGITIILGIIWMVTCNNRTLRSKGCTKRHHDHPLEYFGHYCEFPFGDVGSKVLSGYGHRLKNWGCVLPIGRIGLRIGWVTHSFHWERLAQWKNRSKMPRPMCQSVTTNIIVHATKSVITLTLHFDTNRCSKWFL